MKMPSKLPAAITLIAAFGLTVAFAQNQVPTQPMPSVAPALPAQASSAAIVFDATATVSALTDASYETKGNAISQAQASVSANARAVVELQGKPNLSAQTESALNTAMNARTAVADRIDALRMATADKFDAARDATIEALKAYATATAKLEATLRSS